MNAQSSSIGIRLSKAIYSVIIMELVIIGGALIIHSYSLEALQTITRLSGRLSFLLFFVIFLFHGKQKLLRYMTERFYLVFAVAHGIHLLELLSYIKFSGNQLIPHRVAGGALAYAFIFIMPWLQSVYEQNKISSRSFAISEYVYQFYIWFIFFMTYLPRVMGKLPNVGGSFLEHVILFLIVIIALIVRLLRFIPGSNR